MIERDANERPVQVQGPMPWTWALSSLQAWLFLPLLLYGCLPTGDNGEQLSGTGGNHLPIVRAISLHPSPLILSGPLAAIVQAQDDDGDALAFRYRWFANGKLVAERKTETIEPGLFKRGDKVAVEVVPFDGKDSGAPYKSEVATIGNTPPIVSNISIEPDEQSFARQVMVKADVSDPDGDTVTIIYRWKKNQAVVKEGPSTELEIVGFDAKDSIQVDVLASDGITEAKPAASNVFVMNNTAPKITSVPASSLQSNRYEYHVAAQDPDGDVIVFSLEAGPSGMTIDGQSGMLRWTPGGDAAGVHRIRVMAKDSRGGFASQEFELSIAAPPKT